MNLNSLVQVAKDKNIHKVLKIVKFFTQPDENIISNFL